MASLSGTLYWVVGVHGGGVGNSIVISESRLATSPNFLVCAWTVEITYCSDLAFCIFCCSKKRH